MVSSEQFLVLLLKKKIKKISCNFVIYYFERNDDSKRKKIGKMATYILHYTHCDCFVLL